MKYNTVYIVINEGEVAYASEDKEDAEAYADTKGYEARERVLNEWGNDDPSDKNIGEADLQAGMDGDFYEVEKVNISEKSEDDTIELSDGTEIDVSDIIEKL